MAKHIIRISFSFFLLTYIGLRIDWQAISSAFLGINIVFYTASTVISISGGFFMAWKYHLLLKNTELALSVKRLMVIQSISRFYALILPTALGPEAVRWYKVTKNKPGKSFFLAVTVYERLFFLMVLLGFGLAPLFFFPTHPQVTALRDRILPVSLACAAALSALMLFLLLPSIQQPVKGLIKKGLRLPSGGKLDLLLNNMTLKDRSPALFTLLLLLTVCWQIGFILRICFLFWAMGLPFGVVEAAWMGSLVLLLQVLPVTFAGLGIREGAYAYLFTLYGLPAEQGIVIGLLFFTQMLIFAGAGAGLTLFER